MALQSSGAISLADVQSQFGGTASTSISEYYGVDAGVPASGQISLSNFYGRAAGLTPGPAKVTYSIPSAAGGVGEGFWRTAASWYNGTNRQGTVRFWGTVQGGPTKITGYSMYVDGVLVSTQAPYYGGPAFWSWDFNRSVVRGSYAYLSVYAWGAFGNDRVRSGTFNVGYN